MQPIFLFICSTLLLIIQSVHGESTSQILEAFCSKRQPLKPIELGGVKFVPDGGISYLFTVNLKKKMTQKKKNKIKETVSAINEEIKKDLLSPVTSEGKASSALFKIHILSAFISSYNGQSEEFTSETAINPDQWFNIPDKPAQLLYGWQLRCLGSINKPVHIYLTYN